MKNLILCTAFLAITFQLSASIIRVNNTGVDADFIDLPSAVAAAIAGDTIHVEPSPTSYGTITINKELVLIGAGFHLGENMGLQANAITSKILRIYLSPGAENTVITGLEITYINRTGSGVISDILITRNRILQIALTSNQNMTDIYITQNYFIGTSSTYGLQTIGSGIKTFVVINNIFDVGVSNHNRINMDANTTSIFSQNVFNGREVSTYSSTFQNNIFPRDLIVNNGFSNTYMNNIGVGNALPVGNGNQLNVTMTTVFEDFNNSSSNFTSDSRYQLKAGSPAIGAGVTGEDCGAFGGVAPYRLSGIPAIPTIYSFIAPSIVTGNFTVTLSTRSNN